MTVTSGAPRILVATDNMDDASQILEELVGEFENVRASTNPDHAVEDFEEVEPDVLVLAFDCLDKAQRYYLGLYRRGSTLPQNGHRTVMLCSREELKAVVELCKKDYFDDYVLYWPLSQDGARLATSIRIACREMAAVRDNRTRPMELMAHARRLEDLDSLLSSDLADTEREATGARQSLASAEHEIAVGIDAFSSSLTCDKAASWVEVKNTKTLARELEHLKNQQIAVTRKTGAIAVDSAQARARKLKDSIGPSLAEARALAKNVCRNRPLVMVVEDDEFARRLVSQTLDPLVWESVFACDGVEALSHLRRMRPDVILMDIRLPGLDGVSLTQRLKASPHLAAIPVIIMTGDARKETLASSVAAGAVAFVVKPFTRELLTAKLEKALTR